ncbi:multicopper oxidase family protein [uncultured Tateyamaria sp.]|uniref:multicopper oxidase family protein n=1 Tax=uncultured Tateyamaria sp. TaxID=455651 RepID=UPI00260DA726|nr:multicopper oxidase domain-containing protein [uncultured Tateyamaria sp.]
MKRFLRPGAAFALGLLAATTLSAQDNAQVVNPLLFNAIPLDRSDFRLKSAPAAPLDRRTSREVRLEMNISYLDREIFNPVSGDYDPVRLRGYSDALNTGTPSSALVGPTIEVSPGQTARIKLNNNMPPDATCNMGKGGSINTPHCFNGTNLHTHGLWVNPAGNGDNVLISIRPGVSFEYEYAIPDDHPAGTFWYHPHLHGSTALQVSSGMSGAIIIRDNRAPVPDSDGGFARTGDLDRLLVNEDMQPIQDRVLVLQQIQYACRDADGAIQTNADGTYRCDEGQVGGIEGYDQFGPNTWPTSGRYTSVNGEVLGRLAEATVGVPERWRMIHAGVRDTINFEIRPRIGDGPFRGIASADTDSWIEENCGPALNYHVVAQDGLTMSAAQQRDQAILQPGYRVDALVTFPEAGEYCVVDGDAPAVASIGTPEPSRRLLGVVTATGDAPAGVSGTEWLTEWLMAAAARTMPDDVVDRIQGDLADGLRLSAFVPHPDVTDDEVTGYQELAFNIDLSLPGAALFEIDGKPYDANRVDRLLALGDVEEWTLKSDFDGHPFHIHVNPFQVVKILNADGVDVSALGSDDGGDPQYGGLKGVWKDTLWVKNTGKTADTQYTVVVRTRYQRYIGEFVLHCHILDHEDQGMMQNVKIALPDGSGGVAMAHH